MKLLTFFKELLFPERCFICNDLSEYPHFVCRKCALSYPLKQSKDLCPRCKKNVDGCICKNLIPEITEVISSVPYEKTYVSAVKRLKTDGTSELKNDIACLLKNSYLDNIKDDNYPFVTYIPMDREKEMKRGHNSSKTLAFEFAFLTGKELIDPPFKKVKGQEQHSLSYKERFINAEKTFIRDKVSLKGNFIVVDDVITTGATANAACKILKECGADKMIILTFATTAKDRY